MIKYMIRGAAKPQAARVVEPNFGVLWILRDGRGFGTVLILVEDIVYLLDVKSRLCKG